MEPRPEWAIIMRDTIILTDKYLIPTMRKKLDSNACEVLFLGIQNPRPKVSKGFHGEPAILFNSVFG